MKKINWKKVWLEIGEAFETPWEKRTKRQSNLTNWMWVCREGICWALRNFTHEDPLDYLVEGMPLYQYWWPRTDDGDTYRATFCYFMAAMGDEFEEFLEWCKEN